MKEKGEKSCTPEEFHSTASSPTNVPLGHRRPFGPYNGNMKNGSFAMFKNSPASTGNPIHIQNINHKPPKQNNPKFIQPDSNVRHVLGSVLIVSDDFRSNRKSMGKTLVPFHLLGYDNCNSRHLLTFNHLSAGELNIVSFVCLSHRTQSTTT